MDEDQRRWAGVVGIGQVAIPVDDVDRATEFYREVLGLPHLFSAPPGLSFLSCGDTRLMLAAPEASGGEGSDRGVLLYYRVSDIGAAHERLAAAGTRVVAGPHSVHRSGGTELWIGFYRDPEGNLFATMAETPTRKVNGG